MTLETGQLVGLLPGIAEQVVAEQRELYSRLQAELEDRPTSVDVLTGRHVKVRRSDRLMKSREEADFYQQRLSLAQGYYDSVSQLAADQLAAERAGGGRQGQRRRTYGVPATAAV